MALPVKALKAGQESYWLDQIAKNREEYFSGKGESPGRFVGGVAAASGLVGEATPEQVHAMFRGLDPATGAQRGKPLLRADPRSKLPAAPLLAALQAREQNSSELERLAGSKALAGDVRSVQAACKLGASRRVKVETVERVCRKVLGLAPRELYGEAFDRAWCHRGKRVDARVSALDHCFSSPKSVSLLAGGGGAQVRRQVQEARAEAVAVAIGYLEQRGIGVRRDHNGTDRYLAKGGLLGIAFEHRVSRAGDPQYHTHVLVQNAAKGPDGRWTALDSDRLYAHLMAADHLYLAAERAALTERLGVRWTTVDARSGAAEIVGLDDRALLERFSKRSEQIDDWLAEHGLSGIKASSAAAVATRAPKDHAEDEQSVYARWNRELVDAGISERELGQALAGGRGRLASPQEVQRALGELAGPDGLTTSASTFTRTDVVDALCKRLPVAPSAQAARSQAEQLAERFLAERAVHIGRDRRVGVERYSTPELLERERQLVAAAVDRRDAGSGLVRPEVVRLVLDRHATAGQDQAAMVQDVCRSGAGVSVVVGRAGSGKTWALGLAREAFELDGYSVLGTAPTGIATVGLGEEGFTDVRTVDRLLLDLGKGQGGLDERTVLVVDEAAMLGTRKLAPLLDHAQRTRAKVILVGDDRQFAAIDAGGGFRALRLRLGAAELTHNRRQVEPWEQQALDDVRAGRVEQAIAAYAEHERIRAFEVSDERDRALLGDWFTQQQAGEAPVIYAHRRAQVDRLNLLCQRLRADAGELGTQRLAVGDRQFAVGDQVVLGANALARLGVANGTSAVVTGVDVRGRALTVRTTEEQPPRTVRLPGWYLDAEVPPGGSRRVDLAYARTDMRSQGRTEQRALLALDGAEDMQGCYVQLSRSKERTDLYLTVGPAPLGDQEAHAHPRGEPVEPEQLLGRVLSRDGSKTLASDLPSVVDVRWWSTRRLRQERDRVQAARAECPPDRSRELTLAQRRAAELEAARRQALADLEAARAEAAAARGRAARLAARDRLALAEHRGGVLTRQADQAAERVGMLRRPQQQRAGWLEEHDAELSRREQLVTRQLAWQRRVDERAMVLDPPGWLVAELGPIPERPAERQAWLAAAVELDAYRRVHGLPEPAERTQRGGGPSERDTDAATDRDPAQDGLRPQHAPADRNPPGRDPAPPSRPAPKEQSRPARPASRPVPGRVSRPAPDRPGWHRRQRDRDDTTEDRPAGPDREVTERSTHGAGQLGVVLGRQPGRDRPGQRQDWHAVRAALERLAEQRGRLRRGDPSDGPGHRDRDRTRQQDSDRHERDGR